MLQCHPHPGDFSDKSRPLHCSYFMGLQRKQGVPVNEGEQFDIRLTVEEFKHSVNVYNLWKPGMEIRVSHVKRRNLPTFVFPGGIRPSRPTKVTWDSKRSAELKVSGQSPEKSHESGAVASGTDDEKKRKRADDELDDKLRSSKPMASILSSSTEFHDDRIISTASSCSIKCDDSEANVNEGQMNEKSDLNFPEDISSVKSEINRSGRGHVQVNSIPTGSDMPNSKEAEKLAIEKIMSGPYNAHQTFPEEPDELEDDLEYRNQVKGDGSNLDSLNLKAVVEDEPVISNEEGIHSTHLRSGGGLEELEVNSLFCLNSGLVDFGIFSGYETFFLLCCNGLKQISNDPVEIAQLQLVPVLVLSSVFARAHTYTHIMAA